MKTNLFISFALLCLFGTALAQEASYSANVFDSPVSVEAGRSVPFCSSVDNPQGPLSNFKMDLEIRLAESNRGIKRKAAPKKGIGVRRGDAFKTRVGPEPGAVLPDLSIANMIVYNPQKPSARRNEFLRGGPINVAVTVKNVGQAPTGVFFLSLDALKI